MLRIVEFLPWDSAYKRSLADDDEIADRALREKKRREFEARRTGKPVPPDPPVSIMEWDSEREQTAQLMDALQAVRLTIAAKDLPKGKKPPKFKPAQRPETAMSRARRRAEVARHRSIVAQVLRKEE